MNKKEHFSLIKKSFKYDINSWEFCTRTSSHYRIVNTKLDANIWIANSPFNLEVNRSDTNNILYPLNIIEYLTLLIYYFKWLIKRDKGSDKIKTKSDDNIMVKVDDKYQNFLNRHDSITKLLN